MHIIIGCFCFVIIVILIIVIFKFIYKKNSNLNEEISKVSFEKENRDNDYQGEGLLNKNWKIKNY